MTLIDQAQVYWAAFLKTRVGAAFFQFLRVAAAATFASWMAEGFPVTTLTGSDVVTYLELGIQAGAALVLVNYFAPWEKRFGAHKNA